MEHFPIERYKIKYRERFIADGDDVPFYDDITVLYNSEYRYEVIPFNNLPSNRFINAIIRMAILLVIGFIVNTYIFSAISFAVNGVFGIFYLIGVYSGGKLFSKKEKMETPIKSVSPPPPPPLPHPSSPPSLDKKPKIEQININEEEKKEDGENENENENENEIEKQVYLAMLAKFFKKMETKKDNYKDLLDDAQDKKDIKFMEKVDKIHKQYGGKNFTSIPLSEAFSETINRRLKRFRDQRKVKHHKIPHSVHRDTLLPLRKQRRVIV